MFPILLCLAMTVGQGPDSPPVVREPAETSQSPGADLPKTDDRSEVKKPPVVAGWDNGFFLRSEDRKHSLRITGQMQSDVRMYGNRGDAVDIDSFLVRRARLGIEATAAEHYEFRLLPDFGQGVARIVDSYVNVKYWDYLQFQAGKFKQPFSYEQLVQDRFVPTMERSLLDQVVPARDDGLMVHGQKLLGDRLDYAAGVFNGIVNGDYDTNRSKDLAARVAVRPFNSDGFGPALRTLQLGMAVTTGLEAGPFIPNPLRTPGNVPWFTFLAAAREDGRRTRWGPELAYFRGPLGVAAQYVYVTDHFRSAPFRPRVEVPMNAFYVVATLLLTGEERTTFSQAVAPRWPFDPRHPLCSPGAWELVYRVSRLSVGQAVFAAGPDRLADPVASSPGATELTLGCNWYLNRWVRAQLNWEHAWFDRPVRLGPGPAGLLWSQDTLFARFQVIF